ncbi:hypothetical protein H4Q26_000902, partial [Puccinia striiformis f. sp. tritici PST-130]
MTTIQHSAAIVMVIVEFSYMAWGQAEAVPKYLRPFPPGFTTLNLPTGLGLI